MAGSFVDLRSDTVTRPTAAMRAAMAAAEVGDDVLGDDPTVNRFQERFASMAGKEAALLVPSGTMSNQIAVHTHCRPGDELLCDSECHIHHYEQGGAAQLSGVSTRVVEGRYGVWEPSQLVDLVRPENEHLVRTRLVALENTHNRGGGTVVPLETIEAVCGWAKSHSLATHLDGARLFNAVVASGVSVDRWCRPFDSVSVCFSKGLGCPVGSVLVGSAPFIKEARRCRKLFGGAMRQAGILAAAMDYALDHHVPRLAEDHLLAQRLADAVREFPELTLRPASVDTNMVIFHIDPALSAAAPFAARLLEKGVAVFAIGPRSIRAVTHLDVAPSQMDRACEALREVVLDLRSGVESAAAKTAAYAG